MAITFHQLVLEITSATIAGVLQWDNSINGYSVTHSIGDLELQLRTDIESVKIFVIRPKCPSRIGDMVARIDLPPELSKAIQEQRRRNITVESDSLKALYHDLAARVPTTL